MRVGLGEHEDAVAAQGPAHARRGQRRLQQLRRGSYESAVVSVGLAASAFRFRWCGAVF